MTAAVCVQSGIQGPDPQSGGLTSTVAHFTGRNGKQMRGRYKFSWASGGPTPPPAGSAPSIVRRTLRSNPIRLDRDQSSSVRDSSFEAQTCSRLRDKTVDTSGTFTALRMTSCRIKEKTFVCCAWKLLLNNGIDLMKQCRIGNERI